MEEEPVLVETEESSAPETPAPQSTDEEPAPEPAPSTNPTTTPQDRGPMPTPGQIRVLPGLNNISATSLQAARTHHMSTLDAILGVTAENLSERRAISNGPFRAQVLMSYDKDSSFRPPSYIGSSPDADVSLPWVVARIDEIHANIPHPGAFNPNGSLREQVLHLSAIKQHYEVGVFLPDNDNPDAFVPQPGDVITVTYTNAATFAGGRYIAIATTDNKIPTRVYNDNPCLVDNEYCVTVKSDISGSSSLSSPDCYEGLTGFLISEGISRELATDISDRSARQGAVPQRLWRNIVPAARFVDELKRVSGQQNITVYGNSSAWRPGSSGAHGTFNALDITCRTCTAPMWNRIMQYCINYWIDDGRQQRMGLGLYIHQPGWNVERQIHIDFTGPRRWVHGQDADGDRTGDPVHEYMEVPSGDYRRTRDWVAISDNVDGWPSGRSVSEVAKDVFFHLVLNPGNDGYITEQEVQQRFNSRMGIGRGFLGAEQWFLFDGEVVPNYGDGDPR